ncbi:hypothetical protein BGZ88_011214 [Linnemannia elongata]|nr:hypothetical protein BGZ88_011214 [Linnemannia elongata]
MPPACQSQQAGSSSPWQIEQIAPQAQVPCHQNPLAIPEILSMIASISSRHTSVSCLRVSRSWCEHFLPQIWTSVDINLQEKGKFPPSNVLERHSSLVRKLKIRGPFRENFMYLDHICSFTYPNLFDLTISSRTNESNAFIYFIQRHQQSLVSISVTGMSTGVLEALEGCYKLQQLHYWSLDLTKPKQWVFLHNCLWSRLKVLYAGYSYVTQEFRHVPPLEVSPELPASSTSIQELTVRSGRDMDVIKAHCWTIQQCPHLVRLSWSTSWFPDDEPLLDADSGPMHLMAEEIRRNGVKWVHIKHLELSGSNMYSRDLGSLIRTMPQLTTLNLSETDINLDGWRVLRACPQLLLRLRELDLENCHCLPGSAVQDMLCTMPNLEVFKAVSLSYTDAEQDDRPWLCHALKELSLAFDLGSPLRRSPSLEPKLLLRLSKLDRLKKCRIPYLGAHGPNFTLQSGLDLLCSLKDLTSFEGSGPWREAFWGAAEVDWVIENWPNLRSLSGVIIPNNERKRLDQHFAANKENDMA